MANIFPALYQSHSLTFNEQGWLNATAAAEKFGKRVDNWLRLDETKEYIAALNENLHPSDVRDVDGSNHSKDSGLLKSTHGKIPYVKTSRARTDRGGGTWLHPDLAVAFARWLDVRFAIWCDRQIKAILTGTHPHYNLLRAKHAATTSFKDMCEALTFVRSNLGKTTEGHHYANEARLIGFLLTGTACKLERETLSLPEWDVLAKVERQNMFLIASGMDYEQRKKELLIFCEKHAISHITPIHPQGVLL